MSGSLIHTLTELERCRRIIADRAPVVPPFVGCDGTTNDFLTGVRSAESLSVAESVRVLWDLADVLGEIGERLDVESALSSPGEYVDCYDEGAR